MDNVLQVKDKTNRIICLTRERYKHILKHPDMQNKLEEIRECVQNPIQITTYKIEEDIKFYYKYEKQRTSKAKYLRTIVRYLNGEGFIITAFYVEKIK